MQTVDEIAEILNRLQEESEINTANLEKVLAGINSKLELLTDENMSSDLIKIYITEIKNLINDKNDDVLTKLVNVDEYLKNLTADAEEKSDRFKELYSAVENNGFNFTAEISSLRDELKQSAEAQINNIAKVTGNVDGLSEKVSDLEKTFNDNSKSNFENLKSVMEISSDDFKNRFEKLEKDYAAIVTIEDFANFKQDFADFLQKILDNANVLHLNSDTNKEQIIAILEKINTLDYNGDFKNIADSISEFKTLFEDNSKMNFQNIIDRINGIKAEICGRLTDDAEADNSKFEKLSDEISNIAENVSYLKDFSSKNSVETLENISKELSQTAENISNSVNTNSELNFGQLKTSLEAVGNQINDLKEDFAKNNDANVFSISSGFENVKNSFDNVFSMLNVMSESPEKVIGEIKNLSADLEELKNGIQGYMSDSVHRVFDSVSEISVKVDSIAESGNESRENLKNELFSLVSDLKTAINEGFSQVHDGDELQVSAVKSVSENLTELRSLVSEAFGNIKEYFERLGEIGKDDSLAEKLLNLESLVVHSSEEYENKVELLQSKLSEFSRIVESNASDSEDKISSSFEEVLRLRDGLTIAHENIKSLKVMTEEKFSEVSAVIDAGIENIVFNTNAINEAISGGTAFGENLVSVENKLETLQDAVAELKNDSSLKNNDILNAFDEKISLLKEALGELNADICNSLGYKAEEIIGAFENIKSELNNLANFDFNNMENEIQAMLENSFEGFSDEISASVSESSAALAGIEVLFKETLNKLSAIEECVTEKLQNNLQLLNVALESGVKDVKTAFEDKLENTLNVISSNNTDISNVISDLKQEISAKFDIVFTNSNITNVKSDEISKNINELCRELKNYIISASQTIIEKLYKPQTDETLGLINQKLDIIASDSVSEQMHERFDELSLKDSEVINSLEEISGNMEKLSLDSTVLNGAISDLGGKLDKFVEDGNNTNLSVNMLNEKLDKISENSSKTISYVEKIGEKIDSTVLNEAISDLGGKLDKFVEDGNNTNLSVNMLNEKLDEISENSSKTISYIEKIGEKIDGTDKGNGDTDLLSEKLDSVSESNVQIAEILSALNSKVDILSSDDAVLNLNDEIDDLKDIIFEQRKFFESVSDEKAEAIDKYLRDVLMKLENVDLEKSSEDIKEKIISAINTLAENITFVEESENIKEFVEEKTDEINFNLGEVQKQLKLLSNPVDDFDYSYSLQDVESDIAKLRLAINNIPAMKFEDLSDDVKNILNSVEILENNLPHDKITDLKNEVEKLSDDIISVSTRTNKILLSTDETYKDVQDSLINFSNMLYDLQEKAEKLGSIEELQNIERKVDYLHSMAAEAANADKMFHKVMMYLGEWIDSTTGNISSISDKTAQIAQIANGLSELKDAIPSQSSIVDGVKEIIPDNTAVFEELKNMLPDNSEIVNCLEVKFEKQEERIDRLEMQLEKILGKLEEKENKSVNRKIDKIEKMLSGFSASIEKLASYVDEE